MPSLHNHFLGSRAVGLALVLFGLGCAPDAAETPWVDPNPDLSIKDTKPVVSDAIYLPYDEWLALDDDLQACYGHVNPNPGTGSPNVAPSNTNCDPSVFTAAMEATREDYEAAGTYTTGTVAKTLPNGGLNPNESHKNLYQTSDDALHNGLTAQQRTALEDDWESAPLLNGCGEYVYKKFYTYSRFQRVLRGNGDDPTTYLALAFAENSASDAESDHVGSNIGYRLANDLGILNFAGDRENFAPAHASGTALFAHRLRNVSGSEQVVLNEFYALNADERQVLLKRAKGLHNALNNPDHYDARDKEWARHYGLYQTLGTDETELAIMRRLYQRRKTFHIIRNKRRRLIGAWDNSCKKYYELYNESGVVELVYKVHSDIEIEDPTGGICSGLGAQISAVDDAMIQTLESAQVVGCLANSDGTRNVVGSDDTIDAIAAHPCDWAPQDFVDDVSRWLEGQQVYHENLCLGAPDLFEGQDVELVHDCSGGDLILLPVSEWDNSPRASSANFEQYLAAVSAQEEVIATCFEDLDVNGSGGDGSGPSLFYNVGDAEVYGDPDLFAAGYDYYVSAGLFRPRAAAGGGPAAPMLCDYNPHVIAKAAADVHFFGAETEVLGAWFEMSRDNFEGSYYDNTGALSNDELTYDKLHGWVNRLDFEILGVDLLEDVTLPNEDTVWEGAGLSSDTQLRTEVSYTWDYEKELFSVSANFNVFGVPVVIEGGATGVLGFTAALEGHITVSGDATDPCSEAIVTVTGSATPTAGMDAFVSAGVGVSGLSIGLLVDLTLLELAIPVEAAASYEYNTDDPGIHVNFSIELDLATLSGSVSVYAEAGPLTWEEEILDWSGKTWTKSLIDIDYDWDLQVWQAICNVSDICDTGSASE